MKGMTLAQYIENLRRICLIIRENDGLPVLQTYYCPVYDEGPEGFEALFSQFVQANRICPKSWACPHRSIQNSGTLLQE